MRMPMVCVGHMGMRMTRRPVRMPMAVLAHRHRIVPMIVMRVVVPMSMFVLERLVFVLVAVRFGQMHEHACEHQSTCGDHHPPESAIAEQYG